MTTSSLADPAAVAEAVHAALPNVTVIGKLSRVPRGYASESWRVETDAGELLVKLRRRSTDLAKLRSQAAAAELARAAGVRAPEILYTGLSPVLSERPLVI
jgi:hypothetical protein